MPSTIRPKRALVVLVIAAISAACSESSPFEPVAPVTPDDYPVTLSSTAGASLVHCPSTVARSVSKTVGLFGGSLELDGTRVTIPFGAVLLPTTITLALPASQHMEVDLTANLLDHISFPVAVTVSIDYSRCSPDAVDDAPLHVWYISDLTSALLENLGGTDNKANNTITFTTIHFSGFSIAQ